MVQTIIICLSLVAIVSVICFTCYKINTYEANSKALEDINSKLEWLKSDYNLNSTMLRYIEEHLKQLAKK